MHITTFLPVAFMSLILIPIIYATSSRKMFVCHKTIGILPFPFIQPIHRQKQYVKDKTRKKLNAIIDLIFCRPFRASFRFEQIVPTPSNPPSPSSLLLPPPSSVCILPLPGQVCSYQWVRSKLIMEFGSISSIRKPIVFTNWFTPLFKIKSWPIRSGEGGA